ncbi:MAG: glucosaminidase domain-containing protein, partial [Flavobacteriaceae bacterium]
CFRVYEDAKESYRDHSLFLKTRSRYAFLFDLKSTNYKAWAKGLKKAGYATDPKYPDKLIDLIERYQLDRFDTLPKGRTQRLVLDEEEDVQPKRVVSEVHRVEKGDTLYSISKKYKVSVDQLIQHNQLKAPTIYPGQELSIPKTP